MKRFFLPLLWMALLFGGGGLLAAEVGRVSLERTLSQFLQLPVRIHRIQFSPRLLTLHQVSLDGPDSPLVMERFQIQGPLFSAKGSDLKCQGTLTLRHPFLNGLVEVSGPVNKPALVGWVEGPQGGRRHFAAQLKIAAASIRLVRLELPEGWAVSGSFGKDRVVLWLHPPDQIPQNLTVAWKKISRSEMNFTARFLADRVSMEGRVGLTSPYPMDLFLNFKDAPVSEIASWILPLNKMPRLAGSVHGRVVLKGRLKQVLSRGELLTSEGRFNREIINGMTLRFQGKGPILQIQNSQLSKPEGILLMEGTLDLRRLGQSDFFSQIHLLPMEKALHFAGWRLPQRKTAQGQMGVDLAYEVN